MNYKNIPMSELSVKNVVIDMLGLFRKEKFRVLGVCD
jgi:hypothetical protein